MRGRAVITVAAVWLVAVGRASAHPVGGSRFDTPVPLWVVLAGAGATVALTALVVAVGGEPTARTRTLRSVSTATLDRATAVASVGFLLAVAVAVGHGLAGPQTPLSNLAALFVWSIWLKGVGLLAILAGSPWRVLSPWRTIYRGLCWIERESIGLHSYPAWLGAWPAFVGVVVLVGVVDNLTVLPRSPAGTARVVAGYGLVMLAGAVAFGESWFERGDPLEVLYRLLGRVAPLGIAVDGERASVVARPPWRETARPVADRALAAVVVAAVYTVSFDGYAVTASYQSVLAVARQVTGIGPAAGVLAYLFGLAVFLATFWAVAGLVGRLGGIERPLCAVAPTVLPIAAAYELAHNYPFVLSTLGRLPTAAGANAVGLLGWLSLPAFWASQVALIVGGHVVAVVAAHRVVVAGDADSALRAHAPLVVLMVAYTVLSLWIVSQPVVS